MADKILKEELRSPDEFQAVFGRWMANLTSHGRGVAVGLIAVIVAAGGYFIWQAYETKQNKVAANDFRKISESLAAADVKSTEQRLADLNGFIKRYDSSSLAPMAWLFKGKTLLSLGKDEEALEAFKTAGKRLRGSYGYLAMEGEANAMMELKRWKEAETIWTGLSEKKDNPLRAYHFWKLGLTQEAANDTDGAVRTYKAFEIQFQNSPLLENVRGRLAVFQKK